MAEEDNEIGEALVSMGMSMDFPHTIGAKKKSIDMPASLSRNKIFSFFLLSFLFACSFQLCQAKGGKRKEKERKLFRGSGEASKLFFPASTITIPFTDSQTKKQRASRWSMEWSAGWDMSFETVASGLALKNKR